MNKSVINRILKLEKLFPLYNFNVEEHINSTIELIENILGYKVKGRINLSNPKYISEYALDKEVFRFLNIGELQKIAYYNNKINSK